MVVSATSARHSVVLTASNLRVGTTTVELDVKDAQGQPAAPDQVRVEPVMAMMGHAIGAVVATPTEAGHFRAEGVALTMTGQWQITVTLVDRGGTDRLSVPVQVGT
ncbi:hypothetical protein D5S18_21025 [Nocardia panacis]|uniref:YtkA-like domain-containing protein n=2 Tax=Nocardia panacis TaxID=2340916 RepID=A0A3A4KJG7_9NOCA|nr:hypothetical protein D5S18_21025 [Nocardia panacis]